MESAAGPVSNRPDQLPPRGGSFSGWELVPAAVLAVTATGLILYAAEMPGSYDIGLAYMGGSEAFRTGHPEGLDTWIGTPFLAMVMAFVSRVATVDQAAIAYNIFDIAVTAALIAIAWAALRGRVGTPVWWVVLFGAVIYAPLTSTLWWKQFNLVVLALALSGFALIRSRRTWGDAAGSALIGLSISIKPVVFLLPLVLLVRRDTRRSGLYSLGWIAVLQGIAQVFLADRAQDLQTLSPLAALANFSLKSQPQITNWACNYQNFSPTSTLCRLVGSGDHWDLQRVAVFVIVLFFALVLLYALAGAPGRSWEFFAAACLLSPMFSPLAWTHYQLLLAPMILLLAIQLPRDRGAIRQWVLLGIGYLLAELTWTPIGTVADLAGGYRLLGSGLPFIEGILLTAAQFSQYFVLAAAAAWFLTRRSRRTRTQVLEIRPISPVGMLL
jgi:hypothetical protein